MLTITHTHEAGTLIEGTTKGDGTAEILKANRWRLGRSIGSWYLPNSRDHRPDKYRIQPTITALEAAGFDVTTELDNTVRSTAEVEAGKIARQEARVDALAAKADRKAGAAEAAWQRHERDVARLPEGGEPIKIGHHSEQRHRNAIARADNSMRRSITAADDATHAAERANAATRTTAGRYSGSQVFNRIQKIEADIRRTERRITAATYDPESGYRPTTDDEKAARTRRLSPVLEELRDKLTYWQGIREQQINSGDVTNYTPQQIKKGDAVKVCGQWRRVARVNPKTVSLETGYSWTDRATYAAITDHRAAS
ncbi:DUF3560 domain-containing protein [Planctomonas sp. JC2975]|nr:DUF3560 domain-containing protein [Planctomonas sp. JC2975]